MDVRNGRNGRNGEFPNFQ
ncbi:unnamed protein product, partial [Adineta ricciae]